LSVVAGKDVVMSSKPSVGALRVTYRARNWESPDPRVNELLTIACAGVPLTEEQAELLLEHIRAVTGVDYTFNDIDLPMLPTVERALVDKTIDAINQCYSVCEDECASSDAVENARGLFNRLVAFLERAHVPVLYSEYTERWYALYREVPAYFYHLAHPASQSS